MGTSGFCPDTGEKVLSNFNKFDISSTSHASSKENKEPCLWLGCRETEGIVFYFIISCLLLTRIISFFNKNIVSAISEIYRFELHIPW